MTESWQTSGVDGETPGSWSLDEPVSGIAQDRLEEGRERASRLAAVEEVGICSVEGEAGGGAIRLEGKVKYQQRSF